MESSSQTKTEVGNYFVSNYPPFSQWKAENVPEALAALAGEPRPADPLGLYVHLPFCRKRCKFCYFKVYTDKNASEIEDYLSALAGEMELYSRTPVFAGRKPRFAYFGGGTPSYLSEKQLVSMVDRLRQYIGWDEAEEVTFECEPGTLKKSKLETIKEIGVTRLSLGVENFNDKILEENGRAHLSAEIERAYGWAREVDFPQINIDLIAGMIGETWDNWRDCVRRAIEMEPDSLTIYQMELPYNTVISKEMLAEGKESPIADWPTKRAWVDYAFEQLEARGYRAASAYTLATTKKPTRFNYTGQLWRGADMIALGVSSFSHFAGIHYQNAHEIGDYMARVKAGELPVVRALKLTPEQLMIREWVLQLKTGQVELDYFRKKFGADPLEAFAEPLAELIEAGMMARSNGSIRVTRRGLLQIDHFLSRFFESRFRNVRYA